MSGRYRLRIDTLDWSEDDAKITVDRELDEEETRYVLIGLFSANDHKERLRALVKQHEERLARHSAAHSEQRSTASDSAEDAQTE